MKSDPYLWAKDRISTLVNKIAPIKNDGLVVSPGQIWSIKKLLVLDYYISGFVTIVRKHFERWYYVDTHSGSGLIGFEENDLKNERFPGSPLVAALHATRHSFTDYFLSDSDGNMITALNTRLKKLKPAVGTHQYNPKVRDFSQTVNFLESIQQFGNAYLVFIDPQGFKEITWDLMERLLKIEKADIFFTFMTYTIALNRSNAGTEESYATLLDNFYGDDSWHNLTNGDELLQGYIKKVENYKTYVYHIPVFKTGENKLYDVIIATNSIGAGNIISDIIKIMDVTTTEMIRAALQVVTKKQRELSEFFGKEQKSSKKAGSL